MSERNSPRTVVAILGANGQLGRELAATRWDIGTLVHALPREKLDITNAGAVRATLDALAPNIVVNASAYTAVDKAESEPELAFAVNEAGPLNLARSCRRIGAALIHVSTDYVFDGAKTTAYCESDQIAPLNVYGASKAAGEAAIRRELGEHVILRTSWLFGGYGNNFPKTMLRLGAPGKELRVVDDQVGCPTWSRDIAQAIFTIIDRVAINAACWGTYHCAGLEAISWFAFAEAIFGTARPSQLRPVLRRICTAEYRTAARRPANSALDCRRFTTAFGFRPTSLSAALSHVLAPQSEQSSPGEAA